MKQRRKPRKLDARMTNVLHELIEFPGRSELEGNLENLVQFLGLGARHAVQLGIGDRDCAKSSERGNQVFSSSLKEDVLAADRPG